MASIKMVISLYQNMVKVHKRQAQFIGLNGDHWLPSLTNKLGSL